MKPRLLLSIFLIPVLSWIPTSNAESCDICPPGANSKCQQPLPPRGGFISCKDTHNLTMNCVGTCLAGHVFPDGSTKMILVCDGKTGIWEPQGTFSHCVDEGSAGQIIQQQQQRPDKLSHPCPELRSPSNGYTTCRYEGTQRKCYGRCNSGYVFALRNERTKRMELQCQESGTWYPYHRFPECIRADGGQNGSGPGTDVLGNVRERCLIPSAPVAGEIYCKYDPEKMTCKATCNSGYAFPGRHTSLETQCFANTGSWHPYTRFPDCRRADGGQNGSGPGTDVLGNVRERCLIPSAPVAGEIYCKYDSEKMTCKATCYSGYAFPGGYTSLETECFGKTASWHPYTRFPDCRRDRGGNSGSGTTPSDLEWVLERCQSPSAPVGGEIKCNYDSTQMTCEATCRAGYAFPGRQRSLETQCFAVNGYWDPYTTIPNCERGDGGSGGTGTVPDQQDQILRRCKRPSAPVNGRINCRYDSTQMTCKATCYGGSTFPGRLTELQTQCFAEYGYWYPYTTFPNCRRDDGDTSGSGTTTDQFSLIRERCQAPPAPTDGEIKCQYDSSQKTCTATCYSGYYFPGRQTMLQTQCFAETGYWQPYTTFPDCSRDDASGGGTGTTSDRFQYVLRRCERPSPPVGGRIDCNYDSTQMTCKATCYAGYAFPGRHPELETQCFADNGYWHPHTTFPDCRRDGTATDKEQYKETLERCGHTPAPANGKYDCTYNATYMECKGECKHGYSFPDGSKELRTSCWTETGYWHPYRTFPDCEEGNLRFCQNREPPVFGRVDCYTDAEGRRCIGRCYNGFQFPGGRSEMTLKCSAAGRQWYPLTHFPHCQSIDGGQDTSDPSLIETFRNCRQPEPPSSGQIKCNYDARGMRCVASCYEGYTFPNGYTELAVQCSTNEGVWYPLKQFPRCQRTGAHSCHVCTEQEGRGDTGLIATLTRCRSPSTPTPGEIQCQYDYKGMNCTGTCKQGYYFPDYTAEKVLTCLTQDGVWYPYASFPKCTKQGDRYTELPTQEPTRDSRILETMRRCRQPESPSPGHISCNYGAEGVTCRGTCQEGYYFPDGRRETILRCETRRGVWSPSAEFPQCLSSGVRSCRVCTVNEAREQPEYTATLRNCRRPESPAPGRIQCFYDSTGMNCTGSCNHGYYFPDRTNEKTVRCLTANGIWYPTSSFPTCTKGKEDIETDFEEFGETIRRCRTPSLSSAGRLSCDYDHEGMNCTGVCSLGYYFPGGTAEMTLRCSTREGFWRPHSRFPSCKPQGEVPCRENCHQRQDYVTYDVSVTLGRCKRPSTPMFGRSFCVYDHLGMNCTATCRDGYFEDGSSEKTTRCLTTTGTWYPLESYPRCIRYGRDSYSQVGSITDSRCSHLNIPVPGWVSCTHNSTTLTCRGECYDGYLFPGKSSKMTLECRINQGVWFPTASFPRCEPAETRQYQEGQQIHQSTDDATYSATLSRCRAPLSPIPGEASCRYNSRGMNCTARCNEGYKFESGEGEITVRCLTVDGTWSPLDTYPKCISSTYHSTETEIESERFRLQTEEELLTAIVTHCRVPTNPTLGRLTCSYSRNGMNCTGSCREGHRFPDGTNTVHLSCVADQGYWTPNGRFPECRAREEGPYGTTLQPPSSLEENFLQKTLRICARPEGPKNGYILCKHNAVERNCTGWCNHRHRFPDGRKKITTNCRTENGVWYPISFFPECYEVRQGTTDQLGTEEEEQQRRPDDVLSKCLRPLSPTNGNISCDYDSNGMTCIGLCAPGYRFTNGRREITLRCSPESGNWRPVPIFPQCIEDTKTCKRPLPPVNGDITCVNTSRTLTCTGKCNEGYRYRSGKDHMATRCTFEDGIWYPIQEYPECVRIDLIPQEKPDGNQEGTERDECKDRPSPPRNGFQSCREEPSEVKCIGTCYPDYEFAGRKSSMQLICQLPTGRWRPRRSFPPCLRKRTHENKPPTTNEDVTSKPGSEIGGNTGTGFEINGELDRMCPKPPTPKGGYIDCTTTGNLRKCVGTCATGYVFPNGRSYHILRCSLLGSWTPASYFPDCITEERYREEHRIDGGQSRNRTSDTGSENDLESSGRGQGRCRRPESPVSGYSYCVYNSNIMECTGKCGPGYRFPSGDSVLIHTCNQTTGRWSPTKLFPACEPICSLPCRNGGSCVRPERCSCHYNYRGNYCEYPLSNCDPHSLEFAGAIQCNHTATETICEIGCPRGTKLNYHYNVVRCSLDGTWTPRFNFRCIEDPGTTIPVGEPCPNSRCHAEITEGPCQRPDTPRPGKIRCVYNSLMVDCTGTCQDGYRFPDGMQEKILTCDKRDGVWSPVAQFPKCEPVCERGCLNGGKCIAANLCYCPMPFRGDYCQYTLSNCDPNRLRFAGIAKCTHTSKETVCQLECPEGTVLDRPEYATVRCSLEGTWSPSIMPRCVEDASYVRRLLEQNHQSRMRYESQYRHSEISHTEAEDVNESREQTGDTQQRPQRPNMYDRQVEDNNRYEQNQGHQSRLSRLEQEDSDLYKRQHGGRNGGTVSHERDELNTGEGRFRHYDIIHGAGGREDYEVLQGRDHHHSSSRQSTETQEHNRQYFRQRVNKKKTETFSERSSHSEHQYSRYHKEHGHGGKSPCSLCSA